MKNGLAMWYKWQKGCESYEAYQTTAKTNNIGFWADYNKGNFILPDEYKRLQNAV